MNNAGATGKWIRRVGLAYGLFSAFGFIAFAFAYFGVPAHLTGKPPMAGLVINAFATAFVLLPYRKVVHWAGGIGVLVAFLLFVSAYSLFAMLEMFRALQGRLPFTVFVFHCFLLLVVWSNCSLLYVLLVEARQRRSV